METKSNSPGSEVHPRATLASRAPGALALVFCEHAEDGLRTLTSERCKAGLPFAGQYRLIDFALSSVVNSGIERVGVVTQYQPRSLHAHLAYGHPWGLDRSVSGLTLLHPYQTRAGIDWYTGTADAIYRNRAFVARQGSDQVLVLSGDQVYRLDLNALLARHRQTKADLTLAVTAVDPQTARQHYTVAVDDRSRVLALFPPGAQRPGPLTVMGISAFSARVLEERLAEDAQQADSAHDLVGDLIPRMMAAGDRVLTFAYVGYWNPMHSVRDYWQAHMDLLDAAPALNLQDASWPIRTSVENRPPIRVSGRAKVSHSVLCQGCVVDGTVEHAVLSPGVHVGAGAVVRNAVVMQDTVIEQRALVENAVLDANVIVGTQAQVGRMQRRAPTLGTVLPDPLTVVTRGVRVPAQQGILAYGPIRAGLGSDRLSSLSEPRAGDLQRRERAVS